MRAAAVAEPAWRTRVTVQRKQRHFGRHCSFSDEAAELCAPSGSSGAELPFPEPVVQCRRIEAATQVSCNLRQISAQTCCSWTWLNQIYTTPSAGQPASYECG